MCLSACVNAPPLVLSAHVQQASDLSLQMNAPQTHGGSPFTPQQCPTGACIRSLATNAGPLHSSFSLADPNTTFAIVNGIQATCSDGTQLDLQAVLPAAHYTQNWTATYNASQITAPEGCCFPGANVVDNACLPTLGQGYQPSWLSVACASMPWPEAQGGTLVLPQSQLRVARKVIVGLVGCLPPGLLPPIYSTCGSNTGSSCSLCHC